MLIYLSSYLRQFLYGSSAVLTNSDHLEKIIYWISLENILDFKEFVSYSIQPGHSFVVKVTTFQVLKQLSSYLAKVSRQLQKGSLEFACLQNVFNVI